MFDIFAIIIFPTYTSSASSFHRCKEVEKCCKKRRPRGRISRCVFILLYISYIVYDLPFTLHARTPLTGIDFSHCCKGWALKLKRKEKEKTIQTRFILVKTVNTTGNCLGGSRLKLKHNFALCCLVLKFVGSFVGSVARLMVKLLLVLGSKLCLGAFVIVHKSTVSEGGNSRNPPL